MTYGTGNNSSRKYLAATEKKSEKIEGELDFLFQNAEKKLHFSGVNCDG